jgi:hypothetical protein
VALMRSLGTVKATDSVAGEPLELERILTDQSDQAAVITALEVEVGGGAPTGLHPTMEGSMMVTVGTTVVVGAPRSDTISS